MTKFQFKLTHDKGTIRLTIPAKTKAEAISRLMVIEGCPRRAISTIPTKSR